MGEADRLVFLGALLLVAGILAGTLSSRIGAPLLLAFLGLGLAVGPDGLGFSVRDITSAYAIGSAAIALILFDGGLHTQRRVFRLAVGPSIALATIGVVVTAAIVAIAAAFLLHLSWMQGGLIGAIMSSTDAAAVFLLLNQGGRSINQRVAATLETEAGFNDPVTVFLTVTLVAALGGGNQEAGAVGSAGEIALFLARQGLLGILLGLGAGWLLTLLLNRLPVAAGLAPILAMTTALAAFAGTQLAGGSGFLAVYICGLYCGNVRLRAGQSVVRFHEGIAWLAQLVLFIMLGLMVVPHRLIPQAPAALGVAAVLMLIARPVSVWLCLTPFRFTVQERLFIAWVGLRGAVPIFLAVIPQMAGLPAPETYFHIAFITVLASLVIQGWTIAPAARWLGLSLPGERAANRLDLEVAATSSREISAWRVAHGAPALDRGFETLVLPRRVRILAVLRDGVVMNRSQLDRLLPEDVVMGLAPPDTLEAVDRLFDPRPARDGADPLGDFVLAGDVPMATVVDLYGLPALIADRGKPASRFMRQRLGRPPVVGDRVHLGLVDLIVRRLEHDEIAEIGVALEPKRDRLESVSVRRRARMLLARARGLIPSRFRTRPLDDAVE